MIYGLWQGGPNYRPSSIHDGDLEAFGSVEAAQTALNDREILGHAWDHTFYPVDKPHYSSRCPFVESSEMHVYFDMPDDDTEPDLILTVNVGDWIESRDPSCDHTRNTTLYLDMLCCHTCGAVKRQ